MTRGLSSTNATAIAADVVRPVVLATLEFDSPTGTLRLHTGIGDLSASIGGASQTFTGVGDLANVETIGEGADLIAQNVRLIMSGLDTVLSAQALQQNSVLRPCTLHLGMLGSDNTLLDAPVELFKGFVDRPNFGVPHAPDEQTTISLAAENFLVVLSRENGRLFNEADHQSEFPGDLGLQYVSQMEDVKLIWGGQTVNYGGSSGGVTSPSPGSPNDSPPPFLR